MRHRNDIDLGSGSGSRDPKAALRLQGGYMQKLFRSLVTAVAVAATGCAQSADEGLGSVNREESESMVESADGTLIGYARIGNGPFPLVFVHGVLDTGESWAPVAEALSEHCSCFVMDRRGRGRSADGDSYSFEREVEDIEAVLRAAGPNVFLLGHSSGAIYTLEAARRVPIAGLVLYEPPLHYQGFEVVVDEIRGLVAAGKLDDAAAVFFTREGKVSDSELATLRQAPFWPQIVRLAPTLVREWDAIFAFGPTIERYRDLSMPTLLLAGSENVNNPKFATADFGRSLSNVRTVTLDGQGHTANEAVPELVANRIAEYLRGVGR